MRIIRDFNVWFLCALSVVLLAIHTTAAHANVLGFQEGSNGYSGSTTLEIAAGSPYNNDVNGFSTSDRALVDYPNGTGDQAGADILQIFPNIFGSGSQQIPFGSTINAATLQFVTTTNTGNGGTVHRMLTGWSPTDTWNSFGGFFTADGVRATSSFTGSFGNSSLIVIGGTQSTSVTSDVQAWSNGAANDGWIILPWTNGQDAWAVWSQNHSTVSARPLLSVTFTPPQPSIGLTASPVGITVGSVQVSTSGPNAYIGTVTNFNNVTDGNIAIHSIGQAGDLSSGVDVLLDVTGSSASAIAALLSGNVGGASILYRGEAGLDLDANALFNNYNSMNILLRYPNNPNQIGLNTPIYLDFANLSTDGLALTAVTAVPEPASLSLLALGGAALLLRRRTRQHNLTPHPCRSATLRDFLFTLMTLPTASSSANVIPGS